MVRILFVHPDLGIGGAERLVVDAALALKNKGHTVSFLTNHHDESHCFEETRNGTFEVKIVGDWLPRNIFGKLNAFFAYLRIVYAAFYTVFCLSKKEKIDVIFVDQISLGVPILKLASFNPKILFYCHFPDQLLSQPGSFIKRMYRAPLNYLEEKTTGQADGILVNSKFTRRIFKETFKSLNIIPDVLYPSLNTEFFDNANITDKDEVVRIPCDTFVFLSINRYDKKKNLTLALTSFKLLQKSLTKQEWEKCYLFIAGGYDNRVMENMEYYEELNNLCAELKLIDHVKFLRSPSDRAKIWLLKRCQTLLYTPENEHFGIVPLEAMYQAKPVIAVNSGGPTETIIHDSTGFLCEPNEESFAKVMTKLVKERNLIERFGQMGRKRVQAQYSFESFSDKLDRIIEDLLDDGSGKKTK